MGGILTKKSRFGKSKKTGILWQIDKEKPRGAMGQKTRRSGGFKIEQKQRRRRKLMRA